MIGLGDAAAIGGGIFGGGAALTMFRWAVNLFFARVDKREALVDAGMRDLIERLQNEVRELRERMAECERAHAQRDEHVAKLERDLAAYRREAAE